jgi:hypothetical protein
MFSERLRSTQGKIISKNQFWMEEGALPLHWAGWRPARSFSTLWPPEKEVLVFLRIPGLSDAKLGAMSFSHSAGRNRNINEDLTLFFLQWKFRVRVRLRFSLSRIFFFFQVLEFKHRASLLLDRCSTTWAMPPALFCSGYFWDRVSLFAWTGVFLFYTSCCTWDVKWVHHARVFHWDWVSPTFLPGIGLLASVTEPNFGFTRILKTRNHLFLVVLGLELRASYLSSSLGRKAFLKMRFL